MSNGFKYWDDCVDPQDMEAMWNVPEVSAEWLDAGETRGQKVHLSRDPDGQAYLTQTEMKAVVDIIISRHFGSKIDPNIICAIAELESDRRPLATRYDRKAKDTTVGIMQIFPKTAERLYSEMHYQAYVVEENSYILFRPFVNIYFGTAYLIWLSNFEQNERSEEFMVRAYKGGTKKSSHKSTMPYWQRYLSVKESLPSRKVFDDVSSPIDVSSPNDVSAATASSEPSMPSSQTSSDSYTYWDYRASPEDMEEMWDHPEVLKEWSKSGEKKGKVRFSNDEKKRPYLSRVELKIIAVLNYGECDPKTDIYFLQAVAELVLNKHFNSKGLKSTILCALAEVVSMRFVYGVSPRPGIMGIDYSIAMWLYMELGFRAYKIESADDLTKPFVSMYFGAAYFIWLSEYEGRERTPQFIVQAYIVGPKNVNFQETGPMWLKFVEALSHYEDIKKEQGGCSIM